MPDVPEGREGRRVGQEPTLPAQGSDTPEAPPLPPSAERLQPGTVLGGRFEVVERLGDGGSGTVYAARDRLIGEDVALKVLYERRNLGGDQLARLRAEVRTARRIAHPNVCRVHDLCEQGGLVWIVMELLRGETLRRRLRRELPLGETLEIARQLGAGLAAAHRAGVVHCDVKPENAILVGGRVALTDFGIARLLGTERALAGLPNTAERRMEGTPAYMAPEQIFGRAVDERTDVYGLAAVLFELVGGDSPFGGSSLPLSALIERILREEPRLPPGRPADASPEARVAIEAVLAHGLAKDPQHRYESVDALVAALVAAAGLGGAARATRPADTAAGVVQADTQPSSTTSAISSAVSSVLSSAISPAFSRSPGSPTPGRTPRPRGARRIATVVHALVEEHAGEDVDEEGAADRAEALLAAAEAALTDSGGVLVGRTPRAIVAVFGASTSRGDEPMRAADAARALAGAASDTDQLSVRLGIDTGRLLVRPTADGTAPSISGDALQRAGRLAAAASPGEVRVSARTARHLKRRFVLEPAGGDAHRITGRRAGAEAAEAAGAPLVGRDRELDRLVDELAGAARDGLPRGALVIGPPGIGKSRLKRELIEALRARAGLVVAAASPEPDDELAPAGVVRALVRAALGLAPGAGRDEVLAAARRVFGQGDAPGTDQADRALGAALAQILDPRGGAAGVPALAAARAALASVARAHPLLIVVDDGHWADDASLDLVEALARGEVEAPLAVLVLARPELHERRPHLLRAFRVAFELKPLPSSQTLELARHILGPHAAPERIRAVAEASDGNPFFVEELARDLQERGGAAAVVPPTTVEEAIQARLDRISPEERDVLRAAAVLGRTFRRRDLGELLSTWDGGLARSDADLDTILIELESRRILFPLPPDPAADDRYALKHALIRDVAYGELAPATRRALHAAAARALTARLERSGDVAKAEQLLELARHQDGAEKHVDAAATYRRAGELAAAQGAPADAARCYRRARELSGDASDLDLLIRLGETALQTGATREAECVLDEALARAAARPEGRRELARALHARANVHKQRAQWDEALSLLERGIELDGDPDAPDDPILAARLRGLRGWILGYILGDNARGLPEAERAVALLEGTPHLAELAGAYSGLGGNYMRAGRWRDQLRCNRRVLEIGEQLGSIEIVARSRLHLGVNLSSLGELEEAQAHLERALELYERMCATALAGLAHDNLGGVLLERGDLDPAERHLREAVRLSELCGGTYYRSDADLYLARLHARRGDLAGARALAQQALDRSLADGSRIDEGCARRHLAIVLARLGEHDAAAAELDRAEALLGDADLGEAARLGADRARVLALRGRDAEAAAAREVARAALEALGATHDLAHLDDPEWF